MIDYQNDMSRVEQLLKDIEKLKEENLNAMAENKK